MTQKAALTAVHALLLITVMCTVIGLSSAPANAAFGIAPGAFTATATDNDGNVFTQAGGHPNGNTSFTFNTTPFPRGGIVPDEDIKDIRVDLPAGVVGNPRAVTQCLPADFATLPRPHCPVDAQVGVLHLYSTLIAGGSPVHILQPVFNLVPADGQLAQFGFQVEQSFVIVTAKVRSEGDYGVTATVSNVPGGTQVFGNALTLWGVPADPVHDAERFFPNGTRGGPAGVVPQPFFTNPTRCGPTMPTRIAVRSWQQLDRWVTEKADSPDVTGCDRLRFEPSFSAAVSTSSPDAPSGLSVDLDFPQNDTPYGVSSPALRGARVTLPEGMTINPASADGLDACTDAQLNLKSTDPVSCPNAAKLGTVEASTPVLEEKLTGGVYLRSQASDDPESGEMFRIALVLENKERGLSVRLPGQIKVDKDSGRIVTEFANNPQVPVGHVSLRLKGGPRAPLATPATCGDKTIDAHLTSWGGQSADVQSTFHIDCAAGLGGFAPSLTAGVTNPVGGAFSPFALSIAKPDTNADLTGLTMQLPAGLTAMIKGNLGTQVGTVTALAGPGSNPLALPGRLYLEGPYGNAPFSLRAVVPAVAGPFDLGTVEVKQKIYVDPITAQVTVVSDPLPTVVKGVPVRLQRLEVNVDKPGFMINPTSCTAKAITGTLGAVDGQTAPINVRFQVGDCGSLDLEPKLALSLSGKGQTTDGKHPAVSATLTQKPGQANLKKVRVALPLSLALDPDNANGLCEFVDGSKTTPTCPKNSIIGTATAITPILDQPLSAPVYFVKNIRKDPKSGREIRTLPKLVIPLVGQNGVKLTLTGTSAVEGEQLVTTFDNIPDAPVSSFKLDIIGGKGGILVVSSADICKTTQIADQQVDGQNNKNADSDVYINTPSCPLKVLSKKIGKTSVAVKVGGLSAGKVTITGHGIRKTTKTITKSTVATIIAKRTAGTPGKVTVSFDPTGPAKARKTSK